MPAWGSPTFFLIPADSKNEAAARVEYPDGSGGVIDCLSERLKFYKFWYYHLVKRSIRQRHTICDCRFGNDNNRRKSGEFPCRQWNKNRESR